MPNFNLFARLLPKEEAIFADFSPYATKNLEIHFVLFLMLWLSLCSKLWGCLFDLLNPDCLVLLMWWQIHADETKSSLQFASRALCVTNCARVNEVLLIFLVNFILCPLFLFFICIEHLSALHTFILFFIVIIFPFLCFEY